MLYVRGSGSASYHPRLLLGLLVYGYATGVFSLASETDLGAIDEIGQTGRAHWLCANRWVQDLASLLPNTMAQIAIVGAGL